MVVDLSKDEKKEEQAPVDTGTGVQSETATELDRADKIAERMAQENRAREKILEREEALAARRAVGGRAEAGGEAPKPPEMTDKEYAEKAIAGQLNAKKE